MLDLVCDTDIAQDLSLRSTLPSGFIESNYDQRDGLSPAHVSFFGAISDGIEPTIHQNLLSKNVTNLFLEQYEDLIEYTSGLMTLKTSLYSIGYTTQYDIVSDKLTELYGKMLSSQTTLGKDVEKLISDNLWDLYLD